MPVTAQMSLLVKMSIKAIPWILSLLIFFQYQRRLRSFELCSFSRVAHERTSMAPTKTLKQVVEVSSENKISMEQVPRLVSSTSEQLHHHDAVTWSKLLESNARNSTGVFVLKKPAWLKILPSARFKLLEPLRAFDGKHE